MKFGDAILSHRAMYRGAHYTRELLIVFAPNLWQHSCYGNKRNYSNDLFRGDNMVPIEWSADVLRGCGITSRLGIIRTPDGQYFLSHGCGCTYDKRDAHVYSEFDLPKTMCAKHTFIPLTDSEIRSRNATNASTAEKQDAPPRSSEGAALLPAGHGELASPGDQGRAQAAQGAAARQRLLLC